MVLKWHAETVSSGGDFTRCPRVEAGEQDTLNFDNLRSVFLLLLTGHGLALAVLIAELFLLIVARSSRRIAESHIKPLRYRRRVRKLPVRAIT